MHIDKIEIEVKLSVGFIFIVFYFWWHIEINVTENIALMIITLIMTSAVMIITKTMMMMTTHYFHRCFFSYKNQWHTYEYFIRRCFLVDLNVSRI